MSGFDHSFPLDAFQREAGEAIDAGTNVLVAAPTGSGKTVVGEQAIAAALHGGGRAFYTTPIKALSNQKFRDLRGALGDDRVGLLTGDHVINPEAPVVVMTTEVLRNMVYASSPALQHLRWVILDEVHFLQDPYRGAVWEEVLIHTPASVRFACLSATVSNAEQLSAWIESLRGPTRCVIEHRRPVELDVLYLVGDRSSHLDHLVPLLVDGAPNPRGTRFDNAGSPAGRESRGSGRAAPPRRGQSRFRSPRRTETVERLDDEGLLPAIFFVFSRKGCEEAASRCFADGLRLTTSEESNRIREIIEDSTRDLTDGDLDVLGYDSFTEAACRGIAAHHAGMVPAFREAVERCFTQGLIRIVFATETLALGINMPARSVVIEQLSKFTGDGHAMLTPAQFTQLTGRAGRRGIDDRGAAVVLWSPWVDFTTAAELAASGEFPLVSSFRPTYNMVANLVTRYPLEAARSVLGRSFAQFQLDARLVGHRRSLAHLADDVARANDTLKALGVDPSLAESFREAILSEQRAASSRRRDAGGIERSLAHLGPGDIVDTSKGPKRRLLVVLSTSERKRGVRIDALSARGKVVRLHSGDLLVPLSAVGHVDLPVPYLPNDAEFRNQVAARLRRVNPKRLRSAQRQPDDPGGRELDAARARLGNHELFGHTESESILEAVGLVVSARRKHQQLERKVEGSNGDLLARFDSVREVMENFGQLEGWRLSAAGDRLTHIFNESDLLVSLALEAGLLDGLDPPDMAAMVSCFTHEHRGSERPPPARLPTKELQERFGQLASIWRDLVRMEQALALPATREPSDGFAGSARLWCSGMSLAECVGEELSGGDFVRNARNLVDLLTQVTKVTQGATSAAASAAAQNIDRDVVLGSGALS